MRRFNHSSSRRDFLVRSGVATIASMASPFARHAAAAAPAEGSRKARAYEIRNAAAMYHKSSPASRQLSNGDEDRYQNRIANFTKALPHNRLGEVEPQAYDRLLKAVKSGSADDFEE